MCFSKPIEKKKKKTFADIFIVYARRKKQFICLRKRNVNINRLFIYFGARRPAMTSSPFNLRLERNNHKIYFDLES